MPPFIGGADQKHPHVPIAGRRQGGVVVLADVIPVEVDVIEGIAGDGLKQ